MVAGSIFLRLRPDCFVKLVSETAFNYANIGAFFFLVFINIKKNDDDWQLKATYSSQNTPRMYI